MMSPEEINEWKLQHPWWNIYQGHWEGVPCQWKIGGLWGLSHSNDFQFLKTDLENIEQSIRDDERKKIREAFIEKFRSVYPNTVEAIIDGILAQVK